VSALWVGKDPTVAYRALGAEDPLQRLWGAVQVRTARARVPACCEPNFCVRQALQFA